MAEKIHHMQNVFKLILKMFIFYEINKFTSISMKFAQIILKWWLTKMLKPISVKTVQNGKWLYIPKSQKKNLYSLYILEFFLFFLAAAYDFHDFVSPQLNDPDFDAKPMILFVGQYSTGKKLEFEWIMNILGYI